MGFPGPVRKPAPSHPLLLDWWLFPPSLRPLRPGAQFTGHTCGVQASCGVRCPHAVSSRCKPPASRTPVGEETDEAPRPLALNQPPARVPQGEAGVPPRVGSRAQQGCASPWEPPEVSGHLFPFAAGGWAQGALGTAGDLTASLSRGRGQPPGEVGCWDREPCPSPRAPLQAAPRSFRLMVVHSSQGLWLPPTVGSCFTSEPALSARSLR